MNALLRWGAVTLIACAVIASLVLVSATEARAVPLSNATRAKIDTLFTDFARPDTPGYALGIVAGDQLVYAAGYGQSNLEDSVPISGQTAFHLASLSKQFTASAITLLVNSGRISLNDPVSKYIPKAAKYGPGLQIKHLVYMTSGLVEYTSVKRKSGLPWFSDYYFTTDEAIAASLSQKLAFTPGSQWAYRNINYMLLAKIVETVTGQSLNDYLTAQFFKPLGMNATLVDDDATQIIPHRAIGYAPRNADILAAGRKIGLNWRKSGDWVRLDRVSPHYGGSGVFSTLEDLAKWNGNFDTGIVGGRAYIALMLSRQKFRHDKDNDAFGLVWRDYQGRRMLDYSGEDLDTNTYMARFPDSHISVICLSNMLTGDCEGRAHQVIDILITAGYLD